MNYLYRLKSNGYHEFGHCGFADAKFGGMAPHPAPCGVHGGTMDVGAVEEELGTAGPTVDAAGVGVVAAGVAVGAAGDEISGAGGGTSGGAGTAAFFMPSRCW